MKALYRRYRPRTLDDVVGQDQVTKALKKALASNKIGHAYLFIGPRGTGKTSVARILAHEINKFDYQLEDDYLDIIEIDAASNTGVDNIRELREKAIIAPTKGKYKVYIIDEVHMLSKSAFNALLKTLEEPPEHVIFIMATTDAYKVPITITSRSQTLVFKLADPSTMFQHLKKICNAEKIKIDDDALKIIVKRGGGSYRDSLSLLDQVSTLSDDQISAEMLNKALGLPQDEIVNNILQAYAAGDAARIREQLILLDQMNIKASLIADSLINAILDNPQNIYLNLLDKLTNIGRGDYPQVKLLLALTSPLAAQSANFAMPAAHAPSQIAAPAAAPAPAAPAPEAPAPIAPTPTPAPAPVREQKAAAPETTAPAPEVKTEPTPAPIANSASEDIPDFGAKELENLPPEPIPTEAIGGESSPSTPRRSEAFTTENFDLNAFKAAVIANIQESSPGAGNYLDESELELKDKRVIIYANKKFNKTQLDKKLSLISELLPLEYEVEIKAESKQSDAELASIAAIMGGGQEVSIE